MLSARPLLLLLAALFASVTGAASAQDRVALVIGNSSYQHAGKLPNPVNDATDIAAALEAVGFEVTLALDLDAQAMRSALHDFSDKTSGVDVAMVYYAGHGIEIDKQNYLIPVDAELKTDRDVTFEAISLELVTEAVNGARSLKMVLLDACRNNPFAAQMVASTGTKRSIGRGLTAPEPGGGTLLAYSAKGGTVAEDGDGRNSPFAAALINHLGEPGLDVQFLFRKVRDDVLEATNQRQEPFVYGSLPGESVYLVPPSGDTAERNTEEPVDDKPAASSDAKVAWDAVKDTTSPAILEAFLDEFPDTLYARFANARLEELRSAEPDRPEEERGKVATLRFPPTGNGNVFVVLNSFSSDAAAGPYMAQLRARGLPVVTIDTNDYDGMTPNFFAVVIGPYKRADAVAVLGRIRDISPDAFLRTGNLRSDEVDSATYHVIGHAPGEELNIRSGPGTDYDIVGTIPHDGYGVFVSACRPVSGYLNEWCEVSYDGIDGYAYARYLADDSGELPR